MNLRNQIIQELNNLPDDRLPSLLKLIHRLKELDETPQTDEGVTERSDRVWAAFLEILKEDEEVFRRLADS
ncbi:MAG: hypothetical protein KME10_24920 [Plectolyngbya sp. WJT66-NPBG17]|jgi:uncharacterized ferritin-like protein (DUF455 family)|nr:hypothetical protein [Plectolyngbya sp. WJT66-NPBG17]